MRIRLWFVAMCLIAALPASAQETRGTISGTVRDAQGVLPGASVKIVNLDTNASQSLVTNSGGYYEAPLLLPGTYQITVELEGFKTAVRNGVTLAVSQQVDVQFVMDIGAISESVQVTAEAPLLDTSSLSTGQNFDRRSVDGLPMFANMPVLLTRFVAGVNSSANVPYVAQGYVNRTSQDTSSPGNVGGNEWTIDGATNGGSDRRLASSPNSDMIQEMRIETANFDATFGHGTGLGISMMTRAGTNTPRGTVNYQYWSNKINSANYFQKPLFDSRPDLKAAYEKGRSHNVATTFGGPVYIPHVIDGRSKLFFFGNFSYNDDYRAGQTGGNNTVPTMANRSGDFSNLLAIDPVRYQIYDPLTTRLDPARPGHVIRDPFPGNIIPANRIVNPMYQTYLAFLPTPNNDPTNPTQEPLNNYLSAAEPDPIKSKIWGFRADYNHSDQQRFFSRWSGSNFTEGLADWTYESFRGLHSNDTLRTTFAGTGNWTYAKSGSTVLDAQFSGNTFHEGDRRLMQATYKPSDVGLPSYMDTQCAAVSACSLPVVNTSGYKAISNNGANGWDTTNIQFTFNVTHVRSSHTIKSGLDSRQHYRREIRPGAGAGNFQFDNTYTRRADDTNTAGSLGLSWAAFMLGIPTTSNADVNTDYHTKTPYYGIYIQDAWRVNSRLTMNFGLRWELEQGMVERDDHQIVGFDQTATLGFSALAQAAYARSPITELPASQFSVVGGPLYPVNGPNGRRAWKTEQVLMPRASIAWKPDQKSVLKAGYGVYYDTLNATAITPDLLGFNTTTSAAASSDFGITWNSGNPAAGIAPITNPFPLRADGTRFETPYGDSLGSAIAVGTNYSYGNPDRSRLKMQRWRMGYQRELGSNMAIEVAYVGSFANGVDVNVKQDVLPAEYWNTTNVRNTTLANNLTANVTNPYYIGNLTALQTSNPALYNRLAAQSMFQSPTIQRNRLLRPFSQYTALTAENQPLGKVKTNALEISFQRRFSQGFSGNFSYTGMRAKEFVTIINEFDKAPTQWLSSQSARPHRVTAGAVYQLPFGASRPFLRDGGVLASILGGWQVGSTFEYQPGSLLQFGNIFFNGDVNSIAKDNPTINEWFDVNAGFERASAAQPANFQARIFPLRIDGLRGPSTKLLNLNVSRTFVLHGSSTLQFRIDAANALNREHFGNPNLTPTSTDFGRITSNTSTAKRFITFITKLTF